MSRWLIERCLLAFPRDVRRRDRDHLTDLALELAEDHGALREAFGLVSGGLTERWRRARPTRRVAVALGGASLAIVVVTSPALASSTHVEEEIITCSADPCSGS